MNRWKMPKKDDKADQRCAFTEEGRRVHDLGKDPSEHWCSGCHFYICEACDDPFGVSGHGHSVQRHAMRLREGM